MRRRIRRAARRSAFTLLEVLMVIVILGVLAALIVPQFTGTQRRAEIDLTKTQVAGLASDLERFKLHCGRFPTSDEGLAALLTKPDAEDIGDKWAGPYIKKPAKDAWQRDLRYESPGRYNEESYDLWSLGPDGQDGTDDDIANWEKS